MRLIFDIYCCFLPTNAHPSQPSSRPSHIHVEPHSQFQASPSLAPRVPRILHASLTQENQERGSQIRQFPTFRPARNQGKGKTAFEKD
jgi:hypothetical protein